MQAQVHDRPASMAALISATIAEIEIVRQLNPRLDDNSILEWALAGVCSVHDLPAAREAELRTRFHAVEREDAEIITMINCDDSEGSYEEGTVRSFWEGPR